MKLTLRYEGDPILRAKATPVREITPRVRRLVQAMFEVMYAARGIGLAAPQVGHSLRIIVLDLQDKGFPPCALINPVIIQQEGTQLSEEGCLSCPGLTARVERAARVVVEYLTLDGATRQIVGEKLLAAALQHEIDHLDGILFIDRLSPTERVKVERQRQRVL
ncbi:MAG: peptide deformylase [bacterium]|nr:peptide deformylase [bacterium]